VIQTIQDRGYVQKKSGGLLPTYIGIAVTRLLREHFPRYVDMAFTAEMEAELDDIARGDADWSAFLEKFYNGGDADPGLVKRIDEEMEKIGYPAIPLGTDPETGKPLQIRVGRNYVYVEVPDDDERRAPVPMDLLIDELTEAKALDLIAARAKLREPIGQHPESGENVYVRTGPYGPYVQLGDGDGEKKPRRISLGRDTDPERVDLDLALSLLSLPRVIGTDPESGKPVRAGLGRYGPYVERERVFASLDNLQQIFTVDLDTALDRIRNKNRKPVLKELGMHPESGKPLQILKGRYGPYVTDGSLNATLGRGRTPEETTLEDGVELLAGAAQRKKTGKKKVAKKKPAKKKATTKKTTKKKATQKKAAAKKVAKRQSAAKKSAAKKGAAKGRKADGAEDADP
jgi:DNA topoisomerase-1